MAENWLQRTVNTPDVIDALMARYGTEQIDSITGTDAYKDAQAALALAMNEALNDTNLSRRKRQAAGQAMIDKLMTGCAIVFMLGYDQAKKERGDAP